VLQETTPRRGRGTDLNDVGAAIIRAKKVRAGKQADPRANLHRNTARTPGNEYSTPQQGIQRDL